MYGSSDSSRPAGPSIPKRYDNISMIDRLSNGDITKREFVLKWPYELALEQLDWWREKDEYERKMHEQAMRQQ